MNKECYCPVNGWNCPYYKKGGKCALTNPIDECDDFATFWDKNDDYWADEN